MADDFHVHTEIAHHPADHLELLIIFFPENGDLRLNDIEKLGNDRGHAAKMVRPHGSTERQGQLLGLDRGLRGGPTNLRGGGKEKRVDAFVLQKPLVTLQVAWIRREVLAWTELHRVDEDRHDNALAALLGVAHQREMPLVQVAHGRHEHDAAIPAALVGAPAAHGGDRFEDLHRSNRCGDSGGARRRSSGAWRRSIRGSASLDGTEWRGTGAMYLSKLQRFDFP